MGPYEIADEAIPIQYDEKTDEYNLKVDPTASEHFSTAIVQAVTVVTGTDPLDLEPLADRIDHEALDCLFDTVPTDLREQATVTFPYASTLVSITASGEITVSLQE